MAIKLIDRVWCEDANGYRDSYIIDSAEDVADLPESFPGSIAVVADKGGPVWMVNASGEWKEQ